MSNSIPQKAIDAVRELIAKGDERGLGDSWRKKGVYHHLQHLDAHLANLWQHGFNTLDTDSKVYELYHVAARALFSAECLIEEEKIPRSDR